MKYKEPVVPAYENVFIGNFILTMGWLNGCIGAPLNHSAIQLIQQTPDDEKLGDIFAILQGKSFLFEFKRNKSKIKDELKKNVASDLLKLLRRDKELFELSLKCHWMGYGSESNREATISFLPYCLINNNLFHKRKPFNLTEFCKVVLAPNNYIGASFEELNRYLSALSKVTNSDGNGSSGFILNISKEGSLSMIKYHDISVMAQTIDLSVKLQNGKETEYKHEDFYPSM